MRKPTNYLKGGGSTFGVITSQTIKAFPNLPIITVSIQIGTTPFSAAYYEGMAYWLSQYPYLAEHNIAGYGSTSANTTVDNSSTLYGGFSGIFLIPAISPTNTTESLVAMFTPIVEHMASTWGFEYILTNYTFPSFYEFWQAIEGPAWAGIDIMVGSRLLDAKVRLLFLVFPILTQIGTGKWPRGGDSVEDPSRLGLANLSPERQRGLERPTTRRQRRRQPSLAEKPCSFQYPPSSLSSVSSLIPASPRRDMAGSQYSRQSSAGKPSHKYLCRGAESLGSGHGSLCQRGGRQ